VSETLPRVDRVLFRKAPIALALAQVRFPVLIRFSEPQFIDEFSQAVRDEYPRSERTVQVPVLFSPEQAQVLGATSWRFSTEDERWSLVLSENALTLEVRGYSSVDEFAERFSVALRALVERLRPTRQTRLGLRYINEFRMPGAITLAEWQPFIQPELLGFGIAATNLFGEATIRTAREDLELTLEDGSLVVRHGLLTGTTVEPRERDEPRTGPFYLLDMDRSDSSIQDLDPDRISGQLHAYNDTLYRFFRWAMLEPLYNALGPEHGC
jgi:uncharacterized protein (TIGR04255 family)